MSVMRILIISDLHIGDAVRCLSLVPEGQRDGCRIIDDDYISQLGNFLSAFNKNIDHLIISGDLSHKATPEQFNHFDIIVQKIIDHLDIKLDNVFFTTGNHDTDWSVWDGSENGGIDSGKFRERYAPLETSNVLTTCMSNANGNLLEEPYFCIWHTDELIVISINTAFASKPGDEPPHGEISKNTIEALETHLTYLKIRNDKRIKILLMHHHPINYENISPTWKDFSILQCHKDLVEISHNYKIDFIIHGHRHQPKFRSDLSERGEQLSIVCSGSFSQLFPSYIYDSLSNQLHVLEIDKRDNTTSVLQGRILNFAYSHRYGWRPSDKLSCGIESKLSFGPNEHRGGLLKLAEEYVILKIESEGCCLINDMIHDIEQFQYKNDDLVLDVINEICENNNFIVYGESLSQCVVLNRRPPNG